MEQQQSVKPRIKKSGNTWLCQCSRYIGIGDKPKEAYVDWVWFKIKHLNEAEKRQLIAPLAR